MWVRNKTKRRRWASRASVTLCFLTAHAVCPAAPTPAPMTSLAWRPVASAMRKTNLPFLKPLCQSILSQEGGKKTNITSPERWMNRHHHIHVYVGMCIRVCVSTEHHPVFEKKEPWHFKQHGWTWRFTHAEWNKPARKSKWLISLRCVVWLNSQKQNVEQQFLESRAGEDGHGKTVVSRHTISVMRHERVRKHSQHGGRLMKLYREL